MPTVPSQPWFPRVLYRTTMSAAGALALAVVAAPWLPLDSTHNDATKLWHLFARDDTLRQVAVLAAVGLWTTAVVCFRAPGWTLGVLGTDS